MSDAVTRDELAVLSGHLESKIDSMRSELSKDLRALTEKVGQQNGRVGKTEARIRDIEKDREVRDAVQEAIAQERQLAMKTTARALVDEHGWSRIAASAAAAIAALAAASEGWHALGAYLRSVLTP